MHILNVCMDDVVESSALCVGRVSGGGRECVCSSSKKSPVVLLYCFLT